MTRTLHIDGHAATYKDPSKRELALSEISWVKDNHLDERRVVADQDITINDDGTMTLVVFEVTLTDSKIIEGCHCDSHYARKTVTVPMFTDPSFFGLVTK